MLARLYEFITGFPCESASDAVAFFVMGLGIPIIILVCIVVVLLDKIKNDIRINKKIHKQQGRKNETN